MVRKPKAVEKSLPTQEVKDKVVGSGVGGNVEKLIERGVVDLEFYNTTSEHASLYGFKSTNPLYVKRIFVNENYRNKGIGSDVLQYLHEYAKENNHDLIFGHIEKKSEPSIGIIKSLLQKNGYSTIKGNNDFYKYIDANISKKYIMENKSLFANGYFFDMRRLSNMIDPYGQVPLNLDFTLISYNSGGQNNLNVIDTINATILADKLCQLCDLSKSQSYVVVNYFIGNAERLINIKQIKTEKIVIVDRDNIVCENIKYSDTTIKDELLRLKITAKKRENIDVKEYLFGGKKPKYKDGGEVGGGVGGDVINPNERTQWNGYKVGDLIDGTELDQNSGDNISGKNGKKYILTQEPLSKYNYTRQDVYDNDEGYEDYQNGRLDEMKAVFNDLPPIPEQGDGLHRIVVAKELGHKTILMWKEYNPDIRFDDGGVVNDACIEEAINIINHIMPIRDWFIVENKLIIIFKYELSGQDIELMSEAMSRFTICHSVINPEALLNYDGSYKTIYFMLKKSYFSVGDYSIGGFLNLNNIQDE